MKLRAYFERHLNDPRLLDLKSEIALSVALVHEGLEAMQRGESGETWRAYQAAHRDLSIAVQAGNETARDAALRRLGDAIDGGVKEYRSRREVGEQMERIRRLVDTETKRQVAAQERVTWEQVGLYIRAYTESVKRNVKDLKARKAILDDFERLTKATATVD